MKTPRILRWPVEETKPLEHPYRDTVIVYALLAVLLVAIAALTGYDVGAAAAIAVAFFVAATAWSIVSWRRRLRKESNERDR
jgi:predicted lysophospholipase L1 biosynthesis ABC-type transport system permease subunit